MAGAGPGVESLYRWGLDSGDARICCHGVPGIGGGLCCSTAAALVLPMGLSPGPVRRCHELRGPALRPKACEAALDRPMDRVADPGGRLPGLSPSAMVGPAGDILRGVWDRRIADRLAVVLPLLLVLALSFVWPHLWCSRICPLGALQDALTHLANCARPKRERHSPQRWNVPLARRTVLGAAAGAALAGIARSSQGSRPRPLRPPGAIDEPEFLGVCVRCGNCIRACPTHIIEPSVDRHGPASLLTPIVHFREGYCLVDCTKCTQVCPSGALVRLSPDGKASRPIGLPQVDMSVCLLAESRECTECGRWCPHAAIRYAWSETEYTLIPEIDAQKCTGCGACEAACPTRPNKAIVVVAIENAAGG